MKKLIFAALVFITLSSLKCKKDSEFCHYRLNFNNFSSKDVYVEMDAYQRDTLLDSAFYLSMLYNPKLSKVLKTKSYDLNTRDCLEKRFTSSYSVSKIHVYVFDANKLENTDVGLLIEEKYYLKKYELSLEELKQLNWQINFEN